MRGNQKPSPSVASSNSFRSPYFLLFRDGDYYLEVRKQYTVQDAEAASFSTI
jgi:hypothetical protein